jgi:hypothetical protein
MVAATIARVMVLPLWGPPLRQEPTATTTTTIITAAITIRTGSMYARTNINISIERRVGAANPKEARPPLRSTQLYRKNCEYHQHTRQHSQNDCDRGVQAFVIVNSR